MHKMSQFKLIREQMMEEVTQIPQCVLSLGRSAL